MEIFLTLTGVVVLALSWISLLISSYKEDVSWGLCTLFLPPAAYLYGVFRLDVAKDAVSLAAIGLILVFLGL